MEGEKQRETCVENTEGRKEFKEEDSPENQIRFVKEITGYEFREPILLRQAFTHPSYGQRNYEDFKYFGVKAIRFVILHDLCKTYPGLDRDVLMELLDANISTEKLARAAMKHELHKFLRHKLPLLEGQIKEFGDAIVEYPQESSGLFHVPEVLADIVQSLVGALSSDAKRNTKDFNLYTTLKIVKNLLQPMIAPSFEMRVTSALNEVCKRNEFG